MLEGLPLKLQFCVHATLSNLTNADVQLRTRNVTYDLCRHLLSVLQHLRWTTFTLQPFTDHALNDPINIFCSGGLENNVNMGPF